MATLRAFWDDIVTAIFGAPSKELSREDRLIAAFDREINVWRPHGRELNRCPKLDRIAMTVAGSTNHEPSVGDVPESNPHFWNFHHLLIAYVRGDTYDPEEQAESWVRCWQDNGDRELIGSKGYFKIGFGVYKEVPSDPGKTIITHVVIVLGI